MKLTSKKPTSLSRDGRSSGEHLGIAGRWQILVLLIALLVSPLLAAAQVIQVHPPIAVDNADQVVPLQRIEAHDSPVLEVASSADGSLVASGGQNGTINVWRSENGDLVHRLEGHSQGIRGLDFSPDGELLISASDDRTVRIWRLEDGEQVDVVDAIYDARIVEVAFSPDGDLFAFGTHRCEIELRDSDSGVLWKTIVPDNCPPGRSGSVEYWGLAFILDGSQLVVGDGRPCCGNGGITRWSVDEYERPQVLRGYDLVVRDLAHSPAGSQLAVALVGLSDVWLMDVDSGEVTNVLAEHHFRVNGLDYSTGGDLLATGSNDTTIVLWDVEGGEALTRLTEHRLAVNEVDFSADGTVLVSGSQDGEVILWGVP